MCTSLRLRTADGSVLIGRTMEYALEVNWELRAVPRGVVQTSTAPDGPGLSWQGTHGYVGIGVGETDAFGSTVPRQESVPDGVNEEGLYAGLLYLPTFADYEDATGVPPSRLLAPMDTAAHVLATCSTVAEAVTAIESVLVWAGPLPVIGVPPLHLVLHDRGGAAAVIEWVGGKRHVHDNPLGVATNSPPFDWHMTNMRNYINQTAMDVPSVSIDGATFAPLGQGSGMLGMPGDFTPPSRFVRAAAFSATARQPSNAADGVNAVMHLLSSFDITQGIVRDATPEGLTAEQASGLGDYTSFSSVSELNGAPAYTVRTYEDALQRRVALGELELSSGPVRSSALVPSPPIPISF